METTFGLRGTIMPQGALADFAEAFTDGPFHITVDNGVIEIVFEDESSTEDARAAVALYLDAAGFTRGRPLTVNLNQSWRKSPEGGKHIGITLSDTVTVSAELVATTVTVTQDGKACIVPAFDSRRLSNQQKLVAKARKDPALASALHYLNEEVVGDDRPLYGIYKAIEALTQALGKDGRDKLGKLAGENKKYVSDVMQTPQLVRHHNNRDAKEVLSEPDCRERTRKLLEAYAQSIV